MEFHFYLTLAALNIQNLVTKWAEMSSVDKFWYVFGFLGQAAFASRFLIQWIASEKAKKSIVPIHFWFFSILGGMILFVYAIHIKDAVFIVGQGSGLIVYSRNLILINRHRKSENQANQKSIEQNEGNKKDTDVT